MECVRVIVNGGACSGANGVPVLDSFFLLLLLKTLMFSSPEWLCPPLTETRMCLGTALSYSTLTRFLSNMGARTPAGGVANSKGRWV